MSLFADPFGTPAINKFREFELSLFRESATSHDQTLDFASCLQALNTVEPPVPIHIPPEASFYDFNSIQPIERTYPFSEHPQYVTIRNFMISTYRALNCHYLPFSLCRRNIKAPASLVYEIWRFLKKVGLINYNVPRGQIPDSIVPTLDLWPPFIYFPDDRLYSEAQFQSIVHPPTPTVPYHNPLYRLLSTPYLPSDQKDDSGAIASLIGFGDWTPEEIRTLLDAVSANGDSWDAIASKVGRTPEECAAFVAQLPIGNNLLEYKASHSTAEHLPYPQLLNEITMAENESMRLLATSVTQVGTNQAAIEALNGTIIQEPKTAEEAGSLVALEKVGANIKHMESLHKERILNCLNQAVSLLLYSVEAKKQILEESKRVHDEETDHKEFSSSSEI